MPGFEVFAELLMDEPVNLDWSGPGLPPYEYRTSPFKLVYRSLSGEISEKHPTRSDKQCDTRLDPSLFSKAGECESITWPDSIKSTVILVPDMRGELCYLDTSSGLAYWHRDDFKCAFGGTRYCDTPSQFSQ